MKIREIFKKKGLKGEIVKKIKEPKEKQKKISKWWQKFKEHWKAWIISFFIIVLIAFIIIFPRNPAHDLFLQYISGLAIWPLAVLILGLVLLLKYKGPISERIRTSLIKKGPSGWEVGPAPQAEEKPVGEAKIKELKEKLEKETSARKNLEEKLKEVKQTDKGVFLLVTFEGTFRLMYRSQFRLLKRIKEKGYMPALDVLEFYREYLKQGGNPKYGAGYMFWLENTMGLIKTEELKITLTEMGSAFLSYCDFMNYSEKGLIPL